MNIAEIAKAHHEAAQTPKKFVAKGHDAQLQEAQYGKIPVVITPMHSETSLSGTVIRRDRYTVTLRVNTSGGLRDLIIFKHAIESVMLDREVR